MCLAVCNHPSYADGQCVLVNDAWYLSYPPHDRTHGLPVDTLHGAYFYSGPKQWRSLQNIIYTHRWLFYFCQTNQCFF